MSSESPVTMDSIWSSMTWVIASPIPRIGNPVAQQAGLAHRGMLVSDTRGFTRAGVVLRKPSRLASTGPLAPGLLNLSYKRSEPRVR